MSTINLNIVTDAWSTITNRIECKVYLQSDPLAIIASIIDTASGHPSRTWSFPGLSRDNYRFEFWEIDSMGGNIQLLQGPMYIVPTAQTADTFRAPVQFQCGSSGVGSGTNAISLDGTGGSPDIRGWGISVERIGVGTMKVGVDYSYNQTTGLITLLNTDDIFQLNEWFNIVFTPQTSVVAASVPSMNVFKATQIVHTNYSVTTDDFGSLIVINPTTSNGYIEVQLPDISTVAANRVIFIEMDGGSTAKIKSYSSDVINWPQSGRSNLFMRSTEKLAIYKFIDPSGPTSSWRVFSSEGNFKTVGRLITDDQIESNLVNQLALVGTQCDTTIQARLYNDYVLKLPSAQVCNYDDWGTGNNKLKYSLSNSTNPSNAGKFFIPDRRNLFERNTDGTRKAGDYQADTVGTHDHITHGKGSIGGGGSRNFLTKNNGAYSGRGSDLFGAQNTPDTTMRTSDNASGQETAPKNYAVNKYVLV